MGYLIDQIHGPWPRAHRLFITWSLRIGFFLFSGLPAFLLRFDLSVPPRYIVPLGASVAIWISVKSLVFRALRLDVGIWRYVSIHDLVFLTLGNGVASAISSVLIALLTGPGYPRSIYFLDFLACLSCTAGMRMVVRLFADMDAVGNAMGPRKDVLIYGAGAAGVMLLTEIRSNPATGYHARGFIDDDPQKRKTRILGLPVLCNGPSLILFKDSLPAKQVLIAVPSANGVAMTRILKNCQEAGLQCKTIPSLAEVIEGSMRPTAIRDVAVEDLLGRKPNRLETAGILRTLEGQVVMVTGAAGSIGSELCRQIARYRPAAIVAYEISETALFFLERDMKDSDAWVGFYAAIGS